jgi:hypothetical protein
LTYVVAVAQDPGDDLNLWEHLRASYYPGVTLGCKITCTLFSK